MAYNVMSMPLSKEQTTDGSKTAQSYHNYYKYEDSDHPSAPSQIGHEHYTYDANGNPTRVENDSTAAVREMYWDEDNRLMVLSDNGKTSRYTYNHAGERAVKSHGSMEGVYINGAPQGITFHETDEYTLYPASIISVNKNRFTKHYFIGDKRIASRIGSGSFNNVYGQNGSFLTAGQQDYAERLNQIETQREDYYRELGIAPGIPTMKGSYGDPENTGVGYNTIIKELGDHTVPAEWAQYVKHNEVEGSTPGAPVQWDDPSDPESAQPGYGFVADNSGEPEETFFYHSDHLGSTSYITDKDGNITQYDAYLPYGELLVDEHSSSEDLPYKFNGKELDEETGLYYYGARYMQPMASIWYGVDPLAEKYPNVGGYCYTFSNPMRFIDSYGLEPTEEEAARMSDYVYQKEKVTLTGGWHVSKLNIKGVHYQDKKSGFKSLLFERKNPNGKGLEYVYATAGTDFTELNDWKNNFQQITGMSEQYKQSMNNAIIIKAILKKSKSELTFVGHSLGGGLAAANAYTTGDHAMTFNAAWVSPLTVPYWKRKSAKIDAYINYFDELDIIQRNLGVRANGNNHIRWFKREIFGHGIKNFYCSDVKLFENYIKKQNGLGQQMYNQSSNRIF